MPESDAVAKYVESFKPYVRLDYYQLGEADRKVLRAMLSYSKGTGFMVFAEIPTLAKRARLSERTVQRVIHGYKRSKKDPEVVGLKARGILSQLAPANSGERRAATYRINWQAFVIDPRQVGEIEKRLQRPLPGMETPPLPDEHERASENRVEKPVERAGNFLNPGVTVTPHPRHRVTPGVSPCHPSGVTVTPVVENLGFEVSVCSSQKPVTAGSDSRSVEIQAASGEKAVLREPGQNFSNPKTRKPATWADLHAGIRGRIERELRLITQSSEGSNRRVTMADRMKLACQRAAIWPNVTDDLVREQLELERAKGEN